jgi:hypothetical protein
MLAIHPGRPVKHGGVVGTFMRDEEISRPNNQILARPATTSKVKGSGGDEQGERLWCLPEAIFSVRCAGYILTCLLSSELRLFLCPWGYVLTVLLGLLSTLLN